MSLCYKWRYSTRNPPLTNVTKWEPIPPSDPSPVPSGVTYEVATKRRPSQARLQIATLHMLRHQIGAHLFFTQGLLGEEVEVKIGQVVMYFSFIHLYIYIYIRSCIYSNCLDTLCT